MVDLLVLSLNTSLGEPLGGGLGAGMAGEVEGLFLVGGWLCGVVVTYNL